MNTIPTHVALRNQWRIPLELALHVARRDLACIYCGNEFSPIGPSGRRRASWEHIINDEALITPENIAVCCMGCNASKGTKTLRVWLQSKYCVANSVNETTLAPVARAALLRELGLASATSGPLPCTSACLSGHHMAPADSASRVTHQFAPAPEASPNLTT